MERKQRLFIYDRKELVVLLLLGVMVAFFAFTLGVHLGKKVGILPGGTHASAPETTGVATTPDHVPSKQDFQDQGKAVTDQAVEESVSQALHDEIERTGIHLDQGKQVALPDKAKGAKPAVPAPANEDHAPAATAAVTVPHATAPKAAKPQAREIAPSAPETAPAVHAAAPAHLFALQIGSYPTEKDANERATSLKSDGIAPYVQSAEVKGRKWYRVYVGSYSTKEEAEKAGEKLKSSHVIDAFVLARVAKSAE